MAIYVKYGSIKGDATQDQHKQWINVSSVQFGLGRAIMTATGAAKNREASEPSISEITVTKELDSSSHEIFKQAAVGTAGEDLKIEWVSTDQAGQTYLTVTCSEALISGYSVSSGGDRPSESVSFNFTKMEFKAAPLDENNEPSGPFTVTYDMKTGKAS
ncbi:MAG: type VI secretion system tube protein Hcp [Pseudomonadota bacterium]